MYQFLCQFGNIAMEKLDKTQLTSGRKGPELTVKGTKEKVGLSVCLGPGFKNTQAAPSFISLLNTFMGGSSGLRNDLPGMWDCMLCDSELLLVTCLSVLFITQLVR